MVTKRKYKLVSFDTNEDLSLERIINSKGNDYEYVYALQEVLDDVLDLREGESLVVQLDRSNSNDKGVLFRVY